MHNDVEKKLRTAVSPDAAKDTADGKGKHV